MRRGDPEGVGIEEEEEDHAEGHEIHVDEEEDAAVVEAPARLHAAKGVDGAGDGDESREDDEWSRMAVGEAGDKKRRGETEQDKNATAYQGTRTRIEKTGEHAILVAFVTHSMLPGRFGATMRFTVRRRCALSSATCQCNSEARIDLVQFDRLSAL